MSSQFALVGALAPSPRPHPTDIRTPPAAIIALPKLRRVSDTSLHVSPPDERDTIELTTKLFRLVARKTVYDTPTVGKRGTFNSTEIPANSSDGEILASINRLLNTLKTELISTQAKTQNAGNKFRVAIDVTHRHGPVGETSSFETPLTWGIDGRPRDIDKLRDTLNQAFIERAFRGRTPPPGHTSGVG